MFCSANALRSLFCWYFSIILVFIVFHASSICSRKERLCKCGIKLKFKKMVKMRMETNGMFKMWMQTLNHTFKLNDAEAKNGWIQCRTLQSQPYLSILFYSIIIFAFQSSDAQLQYVFQRRLWAHSKTKVITSVNDLFFFCWQLCESICKTHKKTSFSWFDIESCAKLRLIDFQYHILLLGCRLVQ